MDSLPSSSNDKTHPNSALCAVLDDDDEDDDNGQLTPLCHPHQTESSISFLSRIKQSLNGSSLGNLLSQNNASSVSNAQREQSTGKALKNSNNGLNMKTPPDSPALTPRRLSAVKHVFTPMPTHSLCSTSHSRSETTSSTLSDASSSAVSASTSLSDGCFSPFSVSSHPTLASSVFESDSEDKWSPTLTSSSDAQSTPPLTPDLLATAESPHACLDKMASITINEENTFSGAEDKKGKDPAPPFPYETLIADISGTGAPMNAEAEETVDNDDLGEWWGLEYTLELSRRDSRTSDTSTSTTGEHSKSRESWAAIHQGTVPLRYEDTNFHEWQKWHRRLEKAELRRRRKRTIDFIEESEHLSGVYIDEVYARRALEIHEDRLTDDEIYDALLWVEYAVERRPDPYYPQEKHNLGWVVKNHRSLACLRELKELPIDED